MFNIGQVLFFATQEKILPFVVIEKQIKESFEGTTFRHKCILLKNKSPQVDNNAQNEETFYFEDAEKKFVSLKNAFFIGESLEEVSQKQMKHYAAFVDRQKLDAEEKVAYHKSHSERPVKQNVINDKFEMNQAVSLNEMMKLPDGSFAKVNIIQ